MALKVRVANLAQIQAKLARLPVAAQQALQSTLKTEVDELVSAMKRAAPNDPETQGANFRDSIHAYPNPDRAISYRIIADAKDEDGKFIASNIEHGHRARDGSPVAARPSFFPTYRARKTPMQRKLSKAARAAIRNEFEG
jgi:hypothetical protein